MTRCVFSRRAETDVEAIGDYIARDSPRGALSFVRELRGRCRAVTSSPLAAPLRPELGKGVRMVVFGAYLIFYRHARGRVIIDVSYTAHATFRVCDERTSAGMGSSRFTPHGGAPAPSDCEPLCSRARLCHRSGALWGERS